MFEAYRIGIRLSLINHVSAGLNVISGNFKSTHREAIAFQKKLNEIKLQAATGVAIGGAGFLGLNLFAKALKPAEEYQHQITQMNVAGMKQLEIIRSIDAAWAATKKVPTASVNENLAEIRELRAVFKGVTDDAIKYMPTVKKIQGALQTVRHGQGNAKGEAYGIAKALEMRGANIDIEKHFVPEADMMARAIIAMGGKISANDFLRTFTHGRAATAGWSNEFTYEILPTLMQELKGGSSGASSNPGTALMSAYSAVVGGTISQKGLKLWQDLGLLDPKKVVWSKDGAHIKGVAPGGIYNGELLQSNPFAFAQYVQKAIVDHGYITPAQQRQAYMYLFQNRTAQFAMTQFGMQPWKFEGDQKLIKNTPSVYKTYDEMMKNDPYTLRLAAEKQWETLMVRIGSQVIPQFLIGMDKVIKGIQTLTDWMGKHQTLTKALTWGFVGLSAALAFSGTIITLVSGFRLLRLGLSLFTGGRGLLELTKFGLLHVAEAFGGKGAGLIMKLNGLQVAAAGAAFGVGYLLGTIANSWLNKKAKEWSGGKNDTLAGMAYDWWNNTDEKDRTWKEELNKTYARQHANSVRPASQGKVIQVKTDVHLDKHKVGTVLTKHQAGELERAQLGLGVYDNSMSLAPTGF